MECVTCPPLAVETPRHAHTKSCYIPSPGYTDTRTKTSRYELHTHIHKRVAFSLCFTDGPVTENTLPTILLELLYKKVWFLFPLRCLDVTSTYVSTTYDYDPNITTANLMTQKCSGHVTLSPKSGRIVCPTKIVTLRPQKVGRSVTVEHYDPLVFLVSIVCDITSLISPASLAFSPQMLGSVRFLIISHCYKALVCHLNRVVLPFLWHKIWSVTPNRSLPTHGSVCRVA